jgi:anti-sigma regulatory factor (Ser/Thr protein kinase)
MILATPEGTGFRVNLAALPNAPHLARRFLAKVMERWGIEGETADDARLLVSELTTNAVLATGRVDGPVEPSPDETVRTIIVRASMREDGLRVEVWDNSPVAPVVVDAEEYAESGRGLFLVETLADEWGCDTEAVAPGSVAGKNVWFLLKAASSAPPDDAASASESAPEPAGDEPDATAPVPAAVPLRAAIPPDMPGQPVALPHRIPSPSRARDRVVNSGQAWWMQGRPDLATIARLHTALMNLDARPPQTTGDQQCVNA